MACEMGMRNTSSECPVASVAERGGAGSLGDEKNRAASQTAHLEGG